MSRRTAADHFSQSRFQTSSISSGLMYFLNEHQFWEEISRTQKAVTAFSTLSLLAELRWLEGPQSGAPYSHRKKGNPWVDFIMVIMASSIARGRVRTTTAKQGICWQCHVTIPGLKFAARVFFLKLTADQVLVFDWIAGSCQVNLLKTGQDCSEAG